MNGKASPDTRLKVQAELFHPVHYYYYLLPQDSELEQQQTDANAMPDLPHTLYAHMHVDSSAASSGSHYKHMRVHKQLIHTFIPS